MVEDERISRILPTDEELCERSRKWNELLEKYETKEENEEECVPIYAYANSREYDSSESDSNDESVDPSEFEDNVNKEDPNFNINDLLNKTKQVIKKRKECWSLSGIDRLMDSFCNDNIADKVDGWLRNNCDYFSSKFIRNSDRHCINQIQINQQNIVMERSINDNSIDSSVDTAKYILSNRKRRKSKVTMTIKQFCYSTRKEEKGMGSAIKGRSSEHGHSRKMLATAEKESSIRKSTTDRASPLKKYRSTKRKQKSRHFSVSSSSSSSSASSSEQQIVQARSSTKFSRKANPKPVRKVLPDRLAKKRPSNRARASNLMPETIVITSSENNETSEEFGTTELGDRTIKSESSTASYQDKSAQSIKLTAVSNGQQKKPSSDLNLTNELVINSTALKSQQSMIQCKESFESMCKNVKNPDEDTGQTSNNNTTQTPCDINQNSRRNSSVPIVLYSPFDNTTPKQRKDGKLKITEIDLEKSIGSELKNRFLGGQKKFLYECSARSKLVFMPPNDSSALSSDSEADILERFERPGKGRIFEHVYLDSAT